MLSSDPYPFHFVRSGDETVTVSDRSSFDGDGSERRRREAAGAVNGQKPRGAASRRLGARRDALSPGEVLGYSIDPTLRTGSSEPPVLGDSYAGAEGAFLVFVSSLSTGVCTAPHAELRNFRRLAWSLVGRGWCTKYCCVVLALEVLFQQTTVPILQAAAM